MIARRSFVVVVGSLALSGLLAGCNAQKAEPEGPDYADDEVIEAMARGLERRFDIADEREKSGEPSMLSRNLEAGSSRITIYRRR